MGWVGRAGSGKWEWLPWVCMKRKQMSYSLSCMPAEIKTFNRLCAQPSLDNDGRHAARSALSVQT
jgi:hypothetical protein